ncbi:MAG: archease [SAR202 cluster bacterium]|nr:archease [SAR202 cluster bacterium]
MTYDYFEHTADIGVAARGATFEQALAQAAVGMFNLIADLSTVREMHSRHIAVTSTDRETLVVDWLNELLFHYEAHDFLPVAYSVKVAPEGASLTAECRGESADSQRHRLRPAVKAATYHGLSVRQDRREWQIRVVLDI